MCGLGEVSLDFCCLLFDESQSVIYNGNYAHPGNAGSFFVILKIRTRFCSVFSLASHVSGTYLLLLVKDLSHESLSI